MAHGKGMWERVQADAGVRARFYDSMDADSRLVMHAMLSDSPAIFHGLASLVDVGGGRGTAAAAIARAFPHIQCTVMDLPHVVAEAPPGTGLSFVAGDMFDHIPTADALLLKMPLKRLDRLMAMGGVRRDNTPPQERRRRHRGRGSRETDGRPVPQLENPAPEPEINLPPPPEPQLPNPRTPSLVQLIANRNLMIANQN
ncbi:hypothetical protein U9M48_001952 [Paspalum notatum var. saurae]|uniref:O-methyltransferase C-terminal domain-containing protein n=1 Tax=Paspalum notatum var. saurae TaxID=547442 RepID=A0AAQ3PFF7_PASNO